MIVDIDHVGIAVHDLDAAVERYRRTLGVEPAHRERVDDQGVEEVLFAVGTSFIQLGPVCITSRIASTTWRGRSPVSGTRASSRSTTSRAAAHATR